MLRAGALVLAVLLAGCAQPAPAQPSDHVHFRSVTNGAGSAVNLTFTPVAKNLSLLGPPIAGALKPGELAQNLDIPCNASLGAIRILLEDARTRKEWDLRDFPAACDTTAWVASVSSEYKLSAGPAS
jgi:hypothetical protein